MPQRRHPFPCGIFRLSLHAALFGALLSPHVQAASFDIADGVTVTTTQTLGNNETGVIQAGGTLGVAGTSIEASGASATIMNSGSISTTGGSFVRGINATGASATITNSGSISTSGNNQPAIRSGGTDARISNSGSISTSGGASHGISSFGVNASLTNSGSITTTGSGKGISISGNNSNVSNSGSIKTSAEGIRPVGADNVKISNSGSISTTGNNNYGIHLNASKNAVVINGGAITTTGDFAYGIQSDDINATLSTSGSITTTGATAHGYHSSGANATLSNSGSISVTGTNAVGIKSTGANGVINVGGRVSATGSATQAIVGANNQTLNLLPGAQIIGTIDLGAGINRVNVAMDRGGPSATMGFTNGGTISQSGKGLSFVNGSTVAIVDTTGLTTDQSSLGAFSFAVTQAVNQQLNQSAPALEPIKLAASELKPGMLYQEPGPKA